MSWVEVKEQEHMSNMAVLRVTVFVVYIVLTLCNLFCWITHYVQYRDKASDSLWYAKMWYCNISYSTIRPGGFCWNKVKLATMSYSGFTQSTTPAENLWVYLMKKEELYSS